MERNDILSNKLIRSINKIEKQEAKINDAKSITLNEIKKELPKKTFMEMTDKIIQSEKTYSEEQILAREIKQKELNQQRLEYDDYIAILKMYTNII